MGQWDIHCVEHQTEMSSSLQTRGQCAALGWLGRWVGPRPSPGAGSLPFLGASWCNSALAPSTPLATWWLTSRPIWGGFLLFPYFFLFSCIFMFSRHHGSPNLTYGEFIMVQSVYGMTQGIVMPFSGFLIGWTGPRPAMFLGCAIFSLGTALTYFTLNMVTIRWK